MAAIVLVDVKFLEASIEQLTGEDFLFGPVLIIH